MHHLYLSELANDRQAELRKAAAKQRLLREIKAANKATAIPPTPRKPRPRFGVQSLFSTTRAVGRWLLVGRRLV